MSDTVSLNATPTSVQHCQASATVTLGSNTVTPSSLRWVSSDTLVALVDSSSGLVTAVADSSGPSTRTCEIIAIVMFGGNQYQGIGVATVVTSADSVTVTVDFGPPES